MISYLARKLDENKSLQLNMHALKRASAAMFGDWQRVQGCMKSQLRIYVAKFIKFRRTLAVEVRSDENGPDSGPA